MEFMKEILIHGLSGWKLVTNAYNKRAGEAALHNNNDMKHHLVEKMCNKFKKPTEKAGSSQD